MTMKLSRRHFLGGLAALPACRPSNTKFDADIIVIGAGLAGLHAARLLEAEGKDVLVLEGASRIGGRLHTFEHGALGYTEGGGEQVGSNYARIIDTANTLGIALRPETQARRGKSYFHAGKLYSAEDWTGQNPHKFPPPFSGQDPSSPLFALAAKTNPLRAAQDWRDPAFSAFDISADKFLENQGLDINARRLIDVALNGNSLETYSMMNLYRSLQLYQSARNMGPSLSIENGAQRLPEAMARSLKRPIQTEQFISAITAEEMHVIVKTRNGETFKAAQCICTIPFGVLRQVKIDAPLNTPQTLALKTMPYTQIYQIHFAAETSFWEDDGLPTDMWTDSPIERIFANRDKDGKPTGVFRAWINGTQAQDWGHRYPGKNINESNFQNYFKQIFDAIRPASGGNIKVLSVKNWTNRNALAGGAYMHWAPRQIPLMSEGIERAAGRLSFAGEHLSYLHTGMEGAMESAENAAFALMDI